MPEWVPRHMPGVHILHMSGIFLPGICLTRHMPGVSPAWGPPGICLEANVAHIWPIYASYMPTKCPINAPQMPLKYASYMPVPPGYAQKPPPGGRAVVPGICLETRHMPGICLNRSRGPRVGCRAYAWQREDYSSNMPRICLSSQE